MILEALVTTVDADGGVNLAPMGPQVDETMTRLVFRPFQTSRTFQNLKRTGRGVLQVTDDVELLARAAVDRLNVTPTLHPTGDGHGWYLADACRWYDFRVLSLDDRQERTEIVTETIERSTLREFFGFNRAKHAVLEAAILATRLHLHPREKIVADFSNLKVLVDKTGGDQERRAFDFLQEFIETAFLSIVA
ncbi:MAG TPA: DUF447 domain-containing protein [Pirellulales bacterium]|jgi:hypothetical protein|nr:DUF447 domain-containing protein [Pirellulales bacterium]